MPSDKSHIVGSNDTAHAKMPDSNGDVQGMKASGEGHRISIASTIGVTVTAIGLVILLYGLFGDADYAGHSLGININLWWGLVMVAFGLVMTVGGYLSGKRARSHG